MGNNVTTTPVQTLKINEINDIDDNDNDVPYNTNAIKGTTYDGFNIHTQNQYPEHYTNENWNEYGQQYLGQSRFKSSLNFEFK